VAGLAERAVWAVDIIAAPAALLLSVLAQAGQRVHYASGRLVSVMSHGYAGEGKTGRDSLSWPRRDGLRWLHRSDVCGSLRRSDLAPSARRAGVVVTV
jgi:hypothetical protein